MSKEYYDHSIPQTQRRERKISISRKEAIETTESQANILKEPVFHGREITPLGIR